MRPSEDFETKLAHARTVEIAVATWLKARGARILPVYDYSGLGSGKAPKLEAFSASDSLVTPDLLVARRGSLSWCEVKWKTSANLFKNTNEFETGIDLRLWRQYRHVKHETGARVFIVFAHEAEGYLTCDELDVLDAMPSKRVYQGDRFAHMVNWPLRHLHRLAEYRDVIVERAA
jgi:hypothetical protein